MGKAKKGATIPDINDVEWTDYVLGLLSDDEKIAGNPTTDGLRRVFEIALDCTVVESSSSVVQTPEPSNGNRATLTHTLVYVLNDPDIDEHFKVRTVNGSADVYWGNCDKIYRNHPVAVGETRAEGRALRRGLKLRKVVAAEEIAKEVEDIDGNNVNKITDNQLNFIDVLANRLDINVKSLVSNLKIENENIFGLAHEEAVTIIRRLSELQQNVDDIPESLMGYDSNWRN
mgnify:CR=1 FL=1